VTESAADLESPIYCPECDYNLTGTPSDRCPWCGWEIDVDVLVALATAPRVRRHIGLGAAGLMMAAGCLLALYYLAAGARRQDLTLSDGIAAFGVLLAAGGHLAIGVMVMLHTRRLPLPYRATGAIIHFAAWVSIASGIAGATTVWRPGQPRLVIQGVTVNGVMEFVLAAFFFTMPGWTLLALRLAAFGWGKGRFDRRATHSALVDSSLPGRAPILIEAFGPYGRTQLTQSWSDAPPPTTPSLERAIAQTWEAELALAQASGAILYDAPLCRLNRVQATQEAIHLHLGPTSYRQFAGTHIHHAALVMEAGADCFANALGTSATPLTCDGFLALGRRGPKVMLHAGFLHTFGGMIEAGDRLADGSFDVFGAILRELREELGIEKDVIVDVGISGLVRDRRLYQPELLFEIRLSWTRSALAAAFAAAGDLNEHVGVEFIHNDPESVVSFLERERQVTPVAQGAMLLHGRHAWGAAWYEQCCVTLYGELPSVGPSLPFISPSFGEQERVR